MEMEKYFYLICGNRTVTEITPIGKLRRYGDTGRNDSALEDVPLFSPAGWQFFYSFTAPIAFNTMSYLMQRKML